MSKLFQSIILISCLFTMQMNALPLFAASRGLTVVSKEGKSIDLYKDYHAVVIGVSDYDYWPDLPNAVKDAQEVKTQLEKIGFTAELHLNPNAENLNSILANISFTLGRNEKDRALLLYFAGHGETTEMANKTPLGYIIPKDCPRQDEDPEGFYKKAVSMQKIQEVASLVKSKHMLMIFDSCFSGSLFKLNRSPAPAYITEKIARPVRQFITAGEAHEQVPDMSIFKKCLIKALEGDADYHKDGYITGSELGMYLQNKVVEYTRKQQHPQFGTINDPDLDEGDFVFKLPGFEETAPKPAEENETVSNEEASNVQEVKKEVKLPGKMSASEYYNYGLEHIKKGYFDEAIAAWEKALELEPAMINAYEKLAKAYYIQGKFAKAGEIYRKELTLKPDDPMIYYNLGIVYRMNEQLEDAIKLQTQAISLNPKLASAYNELGLTYCKQRKLDKAITAHKTALELDPQLGTAHNYLGVVYLLKGMSAEAEAEFNEFKKYEAEKKQNVNSKTEVYAVNYIEPVVDMEFVFVKGGEYEMGCGDWAGDCNDDEQPAHMVRLDDFYMGKYEVTMGQWKRFIGDTGYEGDGDDKAWMARPGFPQDDNHPVVDVSWNEAKVFCDWLSQKTGKKYRLPTEAEWEYAARSRGQKVRYGTNTGDLSHDLANYYGTGGKDQWAYTSPVGSFPANPLGLYDMAGNVWEWCSDWYGSDYYKHSLVDNPQGPGIGNSRVLRGGSWPDREVRSGDRGDNYNPRYRYYYLGFRVARTP